VKPQRVGLKGECDLHDLVQRIVQTRLHEVNTLACGLERRDRQRLHDFRVACKRLRYALERFVDLDKSFATGARRMRALQAALGEAHDRDVLLTILPPTMGVTQRRLQQEREQFVDGAVSLWKQPVDAEGSHEI
jgi:CHAD domain-containing protein